MRISCRYSALYTVRVYTRQDPLQAGEEEDPPARRTANGGGKRNWKRARGAALLTRARSTGRSSRQAFKQTRPHVERARRSHMLTLRARHAPDILGEGERKDEGRH